MNLIYELLKDKLKMYNNIVFVISEGITKIHYYYNRTVKICNKQHLLYTLDLL